MIKYFKSVFPAVIGLGIIFHDCIQMFSDNNVSYQIYKSIFSLFN